jgi:hypothetical protein
MLTVKTLITMQLFLSLKIFTMSIKHCKWLIIPLVTMMSGCEPKGAEYYEELDLVYTNYSPDYDFVPKKTFAIPDSVIKVTGDAFTDADGDGKPSMVSPVYGDLIISELKKNMAAYGWTLVNKNSNPDVFLLPSAGTQTTIYYWYDWAYWGWYYPGWYPGWGWYYPGYYPPTVTSYRTGSILVQMIDATPRPSGTNIPVVWTAIFNGLAEGSTDNLLARIQTGLGKAFQQSPYLKK